MNRYALASLCMLLTFSSLVAKERIWKDATGQVSIQAELVYWNFRAKFPKNALIQVSCEQPRTVTIPFEVENAKVESR